MAWSSPSVRPGSVWTKSGRRPRYRLQERETLNGTSRRRGGASKMRGIFPLSGILQANLGLNPQIHPRNPLMRIYLTAGVLIGRLAGCSSDQATLAGEAAVAAGATLAGALQSTGGGGGGN